MRAAGTSSEKRWRDDAWTSGTVTEAVAHAKVVSSRSSRCAIMKSQYRCRNVWVSYGKHGKAFRRKVGFGPVRVCTAVGQYDTRLDAKEREVIERLLFLSRCTQFDFSSAVARVARFVTWWCEWPRLVLLHTLLWMVFRHGMR